MLVEQRPRMQSRPEVVALAQGGQVQMPFAKTFFSPGFGMVADRFGVSWMVYVAPEGGAKHA